MGPNVARAAGGGNAKSHMLEDQAEISVHRTHGTTPPRAMVPADDPGNQAAEQAYVERI